MKRHCSNNKRIREPSPDPVTIGDKEVHQYLLDLFHISKPLEVQSLDKEQRNHILLTLLDLGAGFRQISRITGVPYGVIHRLSSKRKLQGGK